MSLEISGGGSVAVTTEALLDAQRELARLADRAEDAHEQVEQAIGWARTAVSGAVWLLAGADRELEDAAREAASLGRELELASEAYGWAERVAAAQQQLLARVCGPTLALDELALAFGVQAAQHAAIGFGDPRLVTALRALADSVDLPLLLRLVQLAPGRALDETPVVARQVVPSSAPHAAAAPNGFGDLARRIPVAQAGQPQLRVERYALPDGEVHWIVYSAGTIDWSLVPSGEPWDDTSNVVGVAGGSAGSTRAAILALKQAGWRPGEPVLPVGHSQGGIVATAIATSGVAPVPMLVTFGSPTEGVSVPKGVVDVAVEHTDDPVPALGGSPRPLADSRLLVRESTPAPPPTATSALPSHSMSGYVQTATQLDASTDPRAVAARSTLTDFTGGQTPEVTLWRGERVELSAGRGE